MSQAESNFATKKMVCSRDKILADFQNLVEPLAKENGATTFGSVKQ